MKRLVFPLLVFLASACAADMTTINPKGQTVDVESRLVKDKENIVVFHHEPTYLSHQLYQSLTRLSEQRKDLTILVVQIPRPDSPVAKQNHVQTFPYVRIYDAKGQVKMEGAPAYKAVMKMTQQ